MENPMKYNISIRYRTKVILDLIRPRKNDIVLDVACGLGYMTNIIAQRCRVVGIDLQEDCISDAKRFGDVNLMVADAVKLPFKDDTFNHVVCSELIEHLPDDSALVVELKRVVKKGGKIIITTPSLNYIIKASEVCHRHGLEKHHREGYSAKQLVQMYMKNGIKVEKVKYSMVFFTQIIMEITKRVYERVNPGFEKQSDVIESRDSALFRLYKIFFFIPLLLMYVDMLLYHLVHKGASIVIMGTKR